jgi:hypothetical protein
MIPTSGGMKWFTLGACGVAGVLAAAVTEWQRRRVVENASGGRNVVVLRAGTSALARTADAKSPVKRAA